MPPKPQPGFQTPKKSNLVAQQIVNEIMTDGRKAGDRLPAEAEMCETYGVGRSTVREALRHLENQGVIRIKTGPGGGPVLVDFDAGFLATNMALHLQLSSATFRDIMNARLVIEPAIAGAAAENHTKETLKALQAVVGHSHDDIEDRDAVVAESGEFHDLVAFASGNPFFEYLMLALHRITEPFVKTLFYPVDRRERLVRDHQRIYDAIASGDRLSATAAMREDLLEFFAYVEEEVPALFDEAIDWSRVNR